MAIIRTSPGPSELANAAALHFIEASQEAIADHDYFAVALAGGSTPQDMYSRLATLELAPQIHWEKVHVFWGDERCVAANHEDSNYQMAYQNLLRHAPVPPNQIHRMEGELDPKEAALSYEKQLRAFFDPRPGRFDLVLLGLGNDGHTASLFPETKALSERQRWVVANYVRKLSAWRLTLTAPVINQAARVTFLVSGQDKAGILKRVLSGRFTPEETPAQMIRPERGQLTWLVDAQAAAYL